MSKKRPTIILDTRFIEENQALPSESVAEDKRIEVNASRIRTLQDFWQKRWNRLPTDQELQQLVDGWIRDEVLYREALRRELDRNDEIIRRRLVQKMQNMAFRLSWTLPPTEDELRGYYQDHVANYQLPAQRTFSQVYFSFQKRGDSIADEAIQALNALNDVLDPLPVEQVGDRSMMPRHFSSLTETEVRYQFGPEFASGLFELPVGIWTGPVRSSFGLHLVLVSEEIPAHLPPLNEIQDQVLEHLNAHRQQVAIERLYQSFLENYEILFDSGEERNYQAEIQSLSDTWLSEEVDKQESKAKLEEIYNKVNAILPPRYQGRYEQVSAAPMSAAGLVFDEDGNVAWDKIWGVDDPNQPFCELAIAGGPSHRGTLLEPVTPEEAVSDLDQYGYVLQELARGLTMITGRTIVISRTPGWIGIQCDSEEMAVWLLRGIIVENVMVRREGSVLLLPAGPKFTLEGEIKNVVTACAKTFHYWNEHIAALEENHEE